MNQSTYTTKLNLIQNLIWGENDNAHMQHMLDTESLLLLITNYNVSVAPSTESCLQICGLVLEDNMKFSTDLLVSDKLHYIYIIPYSSCNLK